MQRKKESYGSIARSSIVSCHSGEVKVELMSGDVFEVAKQTRNVV
jgi:hypothetical protein